MTDINKEEPLYSPEILTKLDSKKYESVYSLPVTPSNPGPGLKFRPLKPSDFSRGYLELLTQLTVVGEVSEKQFLERFAAMRSCPNTYYVTVIEDINTNEIIGSGTLVVEQKFIRNCSARGRVEDIVVSDKYRGRHLGKLLIATLILLAEEFKCYKISLECKDKMVPFYTSMGFYIEPGVSSNYLEKRF